MLWRVSFKLLTLLSSYFLSCNWFVSYNMTFVLCLLRSSGSYPTSHQRSSMGKFSHVWHPLSDSVWGWPFLFVVFLHYVLLFQAWGLSCFSWGFTTLDDFNVQPWLKLDKDFNDWIEGEDYDVYAHFTSDDNVPISIQYIIVQEPQDTTTSPENEYIHALKHHNVEGMLWLGNLLIFKTDWGMEVTNINNEDLPLVKCLATLYATHFLIQLSTYSHFLQSCPQRMNSKEFDLTWLVIHLNKPRRSYYKREHASLLVWFKSFHQWKPTSCFNERTTELNAN